MNDDELKNINTDIEPDTSTSSDQPSQNLEPVAPMQLDKPMNKKSKKPLVVGIIVAAAVVVLGGGSALAYNMWYQNPDKVLSDTMSNMISQKSLSGDGKMILDIDKQKSTLDISNKMLDGKASVQATANISTEDLKFELSGNAVYDKDGTIYVKVTNATELLNTLLDAQLAKESANMTAAEKAMATSMVQAMFGPIVKTLDGQWIKIDAKEMSDKNESDEMTCVSDAYNMLVDDESVRSELTDTYKDHKFLVADEKLGAKDGNLGFTYNFDQKIADEFGKAVEQTKLGKKIASCSDDSDSAKTDDTKKDDSDELDSMKLEIWVNRWSHQLASAHVTAKSDSDTIQFDYTPKYDEEIKIDIPTDAITLDELEKKMGGLFEL